MIFMKFNASSLRWAEIIVPEIYPNSLGPRMLGDLGSKTTYAQRKCSLRNVAWLGLSLLCRINDPTDSEFFLGYYYVGVF
jgi:hypothetical protein